MTCLYGLVAGEFGVFFNEAYYANRTLGPLLSLTFILLMNLIAFSIIIAMVEDAYEIAKARGKTKKGLDPLLVQLLLGLRSARNGIERLPCCPCIREQFQEVRVKGQSLKRGLKRECTVLDMIRGTARVRHLSFWQLLRQEIIDPYGPQKRLKNIKTKVFKDILEQDENLRKARMLLVEKTVLEILMRMSNVKDEDEVITLEDVTQVHFANLQKEKKETTELTRRASMKLTHHALHGGGLTPVLESAPPSMLSHFNVDVAYSPQRSSSSIYALHE